jgi:hypothetical protein
MMNICDECKKKHFSNSIILNEKLCEIQTYKINYMCMHTYNKLKNNI